MGNFYRKKTDPIVEKIREDIISLMAESFDQGYRIATECYIDTWQLPSQQVTYEPSEKLKAKITSLCEEELTERMAEIKKGYSEDEPLTE